MSVYKVIELVGTSDKSWEDAAKQAIDMANKSLRDLRIAEISKMDVRLDEGEIVEEAEPAVFFDSPKSERTKAFLNQILTH